MPSKTVQCKNCAVHEFSMEGLSSDQRAVERGLNGDVTNIFSPQPQQMGLNEAFSILPSPKSPNSSPSRK